MQLSGFVYNFIINSKYCQAFGKYFVTNEAIHLYNTRQSGSLHCNFAKTTSRSSSSKIAETKFWNLLPLDIRNASSLFIFKQKLLAWLLLRYVTD